jgi:hypothetical protein
VILSAEGGDCVDGSRWSLTPSFRFVLIESRAEYEFDGDGAPVRCGVKQMHINWGRGFLRAWVVLALCWIVATSWIEYAGWANRLHFVHSEGECWNRFAKWPDGQAFNYFDVFEEVDDPRNIEINKSRHAWEADSIAKRNRWVLATLQKLEECEAAQPTVHRLMLWITDSLSAVKGSLALILLPPFLLLITGYVLGWIARGFGMIK